MLKSNCLFLLLVTCTMLAFACTTKQQASPPTPIDYRKTSENENSDALAELNNKLQEQKNLFTVLHKKYGHLRNLSDEEKQALQLSLDAAQKSAQDAQQANSTNTDQITAALAEVEKLKQELEKAKQKLEETETQSTTDNQQTANANASNQPLRISVFMVEKQITSSDDNPNPNKQQRGTFLGIESSEDITITAGEIKHSTNQLIQKRDGDELTQQVFINMLLALQFTYADDTYCAKATITDQHLPPDNNNKTNLDVHGKEVDIEVERGECS